MTNPRQFQVVILAVFCLIATPGLAQDAAEFFSTNCVSCHTIGGGRLTGPDLKNVTERKDRAWLVRFMQSPQASIDSGDAYALALAAEAKGVVMPNVAGMTPGMAELLLTMIDEESKLPKSRFAGAQISDRPFTPADIAFGRALFMGDRPLAKGGPACLSCHTFKQVSFFGGGRLGPDLSRAWERLQGRKGMGAWLYAPATPIMQATFQKHGLQSEEIVPLLALFESTARQSGNDDRSGLTGFFVAAFGVSVLGLAMMGGIWRKRFKAVRRPILETSARKILGGQE
jgi:cytochrome c2